jgi:hypothetical protein
VSVVNVVFYQLEVPTSDRSLVQRSTTECDHEALTMGTPWPNRGCYAMEKSRMLKGTDIR